MVRVLSLVLVAASLAACAGGRYGPPPHPHGWGWRDSPGRPYPTALPLPGYDYRFRPDPQGLGRDLPPPYLIAEAPPPPYVPPPIIEHGYAKGWSRSGVTVERRESISEETRIETGLIAVEPSYDTAYAYDAAPADPGYAYAPEPVDPSTAMPYLPEPALAYAPPLPAYAPPPPPPVDPGPDSFY